MLDSGGSRERGLPISPPLHGKRDARPLSFAPQTANALYPHDVSEEPRKTIRVVAAVVERDGRYLITQRRDNAVLPNLWEFPGGRVEERETDAEALRREMEERLAVTVVVGDLISFVSHPYEKYTVDLYLYQCTLEDESLECRAVQDYRWVTSDEFDRYPFTPADEASMNQLLGEG